MKYTIEDQTLALAGILQAAWLVQQIARSGKAPDSTVESTLESLFKLDSDDVEDVYGGAIGVSQGLRILRQQLSTAGGVDMEITHYVIALLQLEKKLRRNQTMLERIGKELERIRGQMEYFSLTHENVIASLGGLYQETISTLMPRILVQGEQSHLSSQANASKIRALLLAGIRSAVLWRQVGGSKLSLLLKKNAYANAADEWQKNL